ncbi:MAG: hypothetical protein WKF76_10485 [Nocardioidaceae bacterium]
MDFQVLRSQGDNHPGRYHGDSTYEVQAGGVLRVFNAEKRVTVTYAARDWLRVTEQVEPLPAASGTGDVLDDIGQM